MDVIKRITSWLCIYFVSLAFFLSVNVVILHVIINPDNIKKTLDTTGTYSKIVEAVTESTLKSTNVTEAGTLPLDQPWVQESLQQAFPPDDLHQKTDVIIDSVFAWLAGKTAQPEFELDFTQNKARFADAIANHVQQSLTSLPVCNLQNIPTNLDPYRVTCRPPNLSAEQVASQVRNDIVNNQDFIKDPKVTWQTFSSDTQQPAIPKRVQTLYKNLGTLMWVLPIITISLMFIGYLLAEKKLYVLKRLRRSFILSAVSMFFFAIILTFGIKTLTSGGPTDAVVQDIMLPIFKILGEQARTIYAAAGVIAIMISVLCTVLIKRSGTAAAEDKSISTYKSGG